MSNNSTTIPTTTGGGRRIVRAQRNLRGQVTQPGVNRGFNRQPGIVQSPLQPPLAGGQKAGARTYCFTLNNYSEDDVFELAMLFEQPEYCIRYMCWGEEVGEEDHTPHLQGYIEFTKQGIDRWARSLSGRIAEITSKQVEVRLLAVSLFFFQKKFWGLSSFSLPTVLPRQAEAILQKWLKKLFLGAKWLT